MVFNPVLLQLKNMEEKFGYKLHSDNKTTPVITLPYADDFCVLTTNMRTHQNIIDDISKNIISMGMRLKPSKCRSLSIRSGKAVDVSFHIGDSRIPSICDEEEKFLGKLLFFSGKSEETYKLVHDALKEALDRIEASPIRAEYKLLILKNYLIPSKRFLLTVHTITKTHLTKLDTFVDKYTKRWAGLPKSATNVVLHSQEALDIPAISSVYTEAHNTSHARTRLQGDQTINHMLDHTLAREDTYTRGHKTTTEAEEMFQNTLYLNTVDGEIPSNTGGEGQAAHLHLQQGHQDQGQLKSGTLKFMLNASIDTLPTPANLKRWKYTSSDKCKLCGCITT